MCVYTDYLTKRHRVGLLNNFSDYFFGLFLDHFIGGGGRPLVLREGWDAVYQYSGRDGGQQSVFSREGWRTNYSCAGRGERLMYW